MGDVSNRFLSVEIIVPFMVLGIGGLLGYGALSEEVKHKASASDVAVMNEKIVNLTEAVDDNTDKLEEVSKTSQENQIILREIRANLKKLQEDDE